MNLKLIPGIINARYLHGGKNIAPQEIKSISVDSRNIIDPEGCLFFAIRGVRHDGHIFLEDLYARGVRYFVVSNTDIKAERFSEAVILHVADTLTALQQIAAAVRRGCHYPVLGITGSNGKTIVKEWLFELLQDNVRIIRNPKSYNSQVGVPLSVWNMHGGEGNDNIPKVERPEQATGKRMAPDNAEKQDTENTKDSEKQATEKNSGKYAVSNDFDLGIFEAGISQPGEMAKLAAIIAPTVGLLTNLGDAHQENFSSAMEKLSEKLLLFSSCNLLIYRKDNGLVHETVREKYGSSGMRLFCWSVTDRNADLSISHRHHGNNTSIAFSHNGVSTTITIPFTDEASIENACHCLAFIIATERWSDKFVTRFGGLHPVAMRLELKQGINRCFLINDYYNSDINSLEIALQFMRRQSDSRHSQTLILSDIRQSGMGKDQLAAEVEHLANLYAIDRLVCIGKDFMERKALFRGASFFYETTDDFLRRFDPSQYHDEYILLKGARDFHFERIASLLQRKYHQTSLEVDLNALIGNLNNYRALLNPGTKVMAMVKAFSYGSGNIEIARALAFNKTDYLAVAVADEGMELREAGIDMPVIVMNPEEHSFEMMIEFSLEPAIYSLEVFRQFDMAARRMAVSGYPIHIKVETGMNRLGFSSTTELADISRHVTATGRLRIRSVFSHLAAADNPGHDDFTRLQHLRFLTMSEIVTQWQPHPVMRHLLNSAGVERFPEFQMEMVRLGIGLYGVAQSTALTTATVGRWTTVVSQVKEVAPGETVGYNRRGKVKKYGQIAVIPVGYADGYDRRLSNGVGKVWINGCFYPVAGNVCMDMTMIDVTGGNVKAGDKAELLGDHVGLTQLAEWMGTIPYEVLTGISQRVKRTYTYE